MTTTHWRTTTRQQTRAQILDGAALVFIDRGLRSATVKEILACSSVARRTFYLHFKNIEAVWLALYEQVCARLVGAVEAAVAGTDDPVQQIHAALGAYVDVQLSGGPLMVMLQIEAIRPESPLAPHRERVLDTLVALLRVGVAEHLSLSPDPLVYRSFLLGIEGLIFHLQRDGQLRAVDAERIRGLAVSSLFALLASGNLLPAARADAR